MIMPAWVARKLIRKWLYYVADTEEDRAFYLGLLYGCVAAWLSFLTVFWLLGLI